MLFLGNNPELGHDIRCEGTSFYFEKKCKPHDIMMADWGICSIFYIFDS